MNNIISKKIIKYYAKLLKMTEDKLKQFLKQYDITQTELENLIYKIYSKYNIEKSKDFENYNEIKKFNRLNEVNLTLKGNLKKLSKNEIIGVTLALKTVFEYSFKTNNNILAFAGVKFNKVPKSIINNAINFPNKGLTFSERIWFNHEKLNQNLKSCIINSIVKGEDMKTSIKRLNNVMHTGKNNCSRLLRTEVARVWDAGQMEAWEKAGIVKKVIWLSVLDGKTSSICSSRNKKIYKLEDVPSIPAHPNCRSCKAPYFEE